MKGRVFKQFALEYETWLQNQHGGSGGRKDSQASKGHQGSKVQETSEVHQAVRVIRAIEVFIYLI